MKFLYEPRNTRPVKRKNPDDSGDNLKPEIALVMFVCPMIVFSRSVVLCCVVLLLYSIVSCLCVCFLIWSSCWTATEIGYVYKN
jgi:hypothetical protein